MFLRIAAVIFAVFFGNILFASLGGKSPIGDLGELLILICAAISFVIAILQAEKRSNQ